MSLSHFISVPALAQWLEEGRSAHGPHTVVMDCRFDLTQPAWGEAAFMQGHIPGALYWSLDADLSGVKDGRNGRHPLPTIEAFASTVGQAGIDANTRVVVYDQGVTMMAARAWWMLRWLGHDQVKVLNGGWPAWQAQGLPIAQGAAAVPVLRVYTPQPRHAMLVDAQHVLAGLGQKQELVVDARAADRYRGEVEPLDRVAGHIPGAVNRPFTDNFEQGVLKPMPEVRQAFEAVLQGYGSTQVVHSCGSGVSATANILAMEEAGLTGSRLYGGSWSEWSSDPQRPVETGDATR